MQRPVLITGFQRQATESLDSGAGYGFADGLVDLCAADLDLGKRPASELALVSLRRSGFGIARIVLATSVLRD